MEFTIKPLGDEFTKALHYKVDNKTKPLGSLGKLEALAVQVGRIQGSLAPQLKFPHLVVFAADHGIAHSGVSAFPPAVTEQMVMNFLAGGAAINGFCKLNQIQLQIVDAGVNADLPSHPDLINAKVAKGTCNILEAPAMTSAQCEQALASGAQRVQAVSKSGSNVLMLGEMGIGNTSAASLLAHVLMRLPLAHCVGRGTGLDDGGLERKRGLLEQAVSLHGINADDPLKVLATFGGFEIAMMCGAYLQAAQDKMLILVDGFIATAAVTVASRLYPSVLDYCVFTHCSGESGHRHLLEALRVQPLVDLQMRLGEGSGAAVAYPLVQAAVHFLNTMASFEEAGVSRD